MKRMKIAPMTTIAGVAAGVAVVKKAVKDVAVAVKIARRGKSVRNVKNAKNGPSVKSVKSGPSVKSAQNAPTARIVPTAKTVPTVQTGKTVPIVKTGRIAKIVLAKAAGTNPPTQFPRLADAKFAEQANLSSRTRRPADTGWAVSCSTRLTQQLIPKSRLTFS